MRNDHSLRVFLFIIVLTLFSGCASTQKKETTTPETDLNALINTLHQSRNETLYYDNKTYPQNVRQLIERSDNINALISAYHNDSSDDLFRFNIIMILNQKIQSSVSTEEQEKIGKCLADGLMDSFSWVRTEAVWGLGYIAKEKYVPMIITLLDDKDGNVVNETILTLWKIYELNKEQISNQNANATDREAGVRYWKGWWEKNKSRFLQ